MSVSLPPGPPCTTHTKYTAYTTHTQTHKKAFQTHAQEGKRKTQQQNTDKMNNTVGCTYLCTYTHQATVGLSSSVSEKLCLYTVNLTFLLFVISTSRSRQNFQNFMDDTRIVNTTALTNTSKYFFY